MEIERESLMKLVRACLNSIDTMDQAVELYDSGDVGTAMAFLGAGSEDVVQTLYEVENESLAVEEIMNQMESGDPMDIEEDALDQIIEGDKEVGEIF